MGELDVEGRGAAEQQQKDDRRLGEEEIEALLEGHVDRVELRIGGGETDLLVADGDLSAVRRREQGGP